MQIIEANDTALQRFILVHALKPSFCSIRRDTILKRSIEVFRNRKLQYKSMLGYSDLCPD